MPALSRQTAGARGEDRGPHRLGLPAQQEFRRAAAHAPLAGAHAAPGLNLGFAPVGARTDAHPGYVLATADQSLVSGQVPELRAQSECPFHGCGESPVRFARRETAASVWLAADGGEAGDFA